MSSPYFLPQSLSVITLIPSLVKSCSRVPAYRYYNQLTILTQSGTLSKEHCESPLILVYYLANPFTNVPVSLFDIQSKWNFIGFFYFCHVNNGFVPNSRTYNSLPKGSIYTYRWPKYM